MPLIIILSSKEEHKVWSMHVVKKAYNSPKSRIESLARYRHLLKDFIRDILLTGAGNWWVNLSRSVA